MKAMVCEMCNSNDIQKQDGLYVCQACGTKYSVEEAKKLILDGPVEIKGTVSIQGTVNTVDHDFENGLADAEYCSQTYLNKNTLSWTERGQYSYNWVIEKYNLLYSKAAAQPSYWLSFSRSYSKCTLFAIKQKELLLLKKKYVTVAGVTKEEILKNYDKYMEFAIQRAFSEEDRATYEQEKNDTLNYLKSELAQYKPHDQGKAWLYSLIFVPLFCILFGFILWFILELCM